MSLYEICNYISTGEKLQELADVYVGLKSDFEWNPRIAKCTDRFKYLESFNQQWDNPKLVFCYSQRVHAVSVLLHLFKNPCIVIFGNSDENMTQEKCTAFLESPIIKHIFCQNLMFQHPKVSFIPIGIANQQWAHGNLSNFKQYYFYNMHNEKTEPILLSMSLHTNAARAKWSSELSKRGITNRHFSSHKDYLDALAASKFCICPEGNGIDTHRLWEALYMKSIPILCRSAFTDVLLAASIPCVLVNSWAEININALPEYDTYDFGEDYTYRISFLKFKNEIICLRDSLF
jgi:hypothetical protein